MSYTLQQLRDYVRSHMDLDDTELPDTLLDTWAREATTRITRYKQRWYWLESEWTLDLLPSIQSYDMASLQGSYTPDEVEAVLPSDREPLTWASRAVLDNEWNGYTAQGTPVYWTKWGDRLYFYPTPLTAETITVRGYRKVRDWVSDGSGATPDMPEEFHNAVRVWMLGEAYNQQEDMDTGISYLDMFDNEMKNLASKVNDTPTPQPLVMNGGGRHDFWPRGRMRFDWE